MALQVLPLARDHGFGSLKVSLALATVIWIIGLGIIVLAVVVIIGAALSPGVAAPSATVGA